MSHAISHNTFHQLSSFVYKSYSGFLFFTVDFKIYLQPKNLFYIQQGRVKPQFTFIYIFCCLCPIGEMSLHAKESEKKSLQSVGRQLSPVQVSSLGGDLPSQLVQVTEASPGQRVNLPSEDADHITNFTGFNTI